MAFDALPGLRIEVTQYQQTYIIGDYFAVFEDENQMPDVYNWSDITLFSEEPSRFVIGIDRIEYIIPKNCFENGRQLIQFRTLAESQINRSADTLKKVGTRIVPPKYNYHSLDISENVFTGTGTYVEKEINAGSISQIYGRFRGMILLFSLIGAACMFACLWIFGGKLEENWLYYVTLSFFTFVGIDIIIFIVFCIFARHRYTVFLKRDISTVENIVFLVAQDGFGAVEQCVYSGKELIPWSNALYFYETKYSVSIVCKDKTVCCIPKRFFQKSSQNDLVTFISGRVEQR